MTQLLGMKRQSIGSLIIDAKVHSFNASTTPSGEWLET